MLIGITILGFWVSTTLSPSTQFDIRGANLKALEAQSLDHQFQEQISYFRHRDAVERSTEAFSAPRFFALGLGSAIGIPAVKRCRQFRNPGCWSKVSCVGLASLSLSAAGAAIGTALWKLEGDSETDEELWLRIRSAQGDLTPSQLDKARAKIQIMLQSVLSEGLPPEHQADLDINVARQDLWRGFPTEIFYQRKVYRAQLEQDEKGRWTRLTYVEASDR